MRVCMGTTNRPSSVIVVGQAIGLVRQINSSQAAAYSLTNGGKYAALAALKITQPTPAGFVVSFTTDGTSYAFSVKDTTDPCLFGYFSDHAGVIFQGTVIQ